MGRTSTTAKPENPAHDVSATVWNAHVTDYVSQTDTNDQNLASDIEIVNGKELRTNTISETTADSGVTIDTVLIKDGDVDGIDVSAHDVASTGVHGAGGDTLATDADIATHAALDTGVHGAGGDTLATDADITTHAALDTGVHGAGGGTLAVIGDITDANLSCTDVTTNNSSTSKHGFIKKLDNDTTHFMRGDGTWAVPAGAGGTLGQFDFLIQMNGADAEAYNAAGTLVYGGASDEGGVNGADHDGVFQAAVNNGNSIFVRYGIYWFNALVDLDNYQMIYGERGNPYHYATAGQVLIKSSANNTLFRINGGNGDANCIRGVTLKGLSLSGENGTGDLLWARNSWGTVLEDIRFVNTQGAGLYGERIQDWMGNRLHFDAVGDTEAVKSCIMLRRSEDDPDYKYSADCRIYDMWCEGCDDRGSAIDAYDTDGLTAYNMRWFGYKFHGEYALPTIKIWGNDFKFIGGYATKPNQETVILRGDYNVIDGLWVYLTAAQGDYPIIEIEDTDRGVIINNFEVDAQTYDMTHAYAIHINSDVADANEIIFSNINVQASSGREVYQNEAAAGKPQISNLFSAGKGKYENEGIAEASNTDTIAHGLAGTPTSVFFNVEETDANYRAQLNAKDATNLTLYLYDLTASAVETVDKTIHWKAKYNP